MPRYTFTYPNVPDAEGSMYDHVREVLTSNQVTAQDAQRCMVVLSEAFTNAFLHGNQEEPTKHISINLSINQKWISAEIIDEGSNGFSKARQAVAQLGNLPDSTAENGRGMALIKHYADSVDFSTAANGGLKVAVRLKRGTKTETSITQP